MVTLTVSKQGKYFTVDDKRRSGSPRVGYGRTIVSAIGDFFHGNQTELGIKFVVEAPAEPAEQRRRQRELAKR